ncbi:MAG TPA: NAD(P)H-hydrate epimerase [Candidatus Limnocylindria bacterium]|nr:NAD(P)H-hydrate epimerase [Candidatus Limnocylindria bacterium]
MSIPVRRAGRVSLTTLPTVRDAPAASAAQMAEADRIASTELGIPLEALMENAARQVAVATRLFLGGVAGKDIVAIAGTGNNGGDALGALRHLHGWGARVEAYVAAPRERLRPLAALQYDILAALGIALHETTSSVLPVLVERFTSADALLDGLLGYSAKGAPRGEIARLIQATASGGPGRIVAVDVPSGVDPDTGETMSGGPLGTVPAALTVTLALPKAGLLRQPARRWAGELLLADIGIPAKAFEPLGIAAQGVFASGDLVRIIR